MFSLHFYIHSFISFRNSTADTGPLAVTLAKVALQVANQLYWDVTGEQPTPPSDLLTTTEYIVEEMLYCYLERLDCDLFRAILIPGLKVTHQIWSLYVGVHRSPNVATSVTGQLLTLLTGKEVSGMNETACYDNHLVWMNGYNLTGSCINSTVNYSIAVSPAFIIEGKCCRLFRCALCVTRNVATG